MNAKVFRDYSQSELDAQYDNRAKVADFEAHVRRWERSCKAVRETLDARFDIAYGEGADEKLDVFTADRPAAPIQFFIHGGYWRQFSKDEFSYVARVFQPRGAITVLVNYSLIPAVTMGELVRQCRAALGWVWRNAADFGGDRERIYISGHSAGGHLVGMLCATDWPQFEAALPADLIKGATSLSGLMDLEPIRLCFLNETLALSERDVLENSPARLARGSDAPLNLFVGAEEGPEYLRQSEVLAQHWAAPPDPPQLHVPVGENHFSIVTQLDEPDSAVATAVAAQMGLD